MGTPDGEWGLAGASRRSQAMKAALSYFLEVHFGGGSEIEHARVVARVARGAASSDIGGRGTLRRLHHTHSLVFADAALEEVRLPLQRDMLHEVERIRHVENL